MYCYPYFPEERTGTKRGCLNGLVDIAMKGQHRYTEVNLDSSSTKAILTGTLAEEPKSADYNRALFRPAFLSVVSQIR